MNMFTLCEEVASIPGIQLLLLFRLSAVLSSSLKFQVGFKREYIRIMLFEVFIATDLRILQLIQNLSSIFAYRLHDIMHKLLFISYYLLHNFLYISFNSKQVSLNASPIEDWETAAISQGRSCLFESRIIQQQDFQVQFEFTNEILENIIRDVLD